MKKNKLKKTGSSQKSEPEIKEDGMSSPVCYADSPDIRAEYLLSQEKEDDEKLDTDIKK